MQYFALLLVSVFGYSIKELAMRALVAVGFGLVTTSGIYAILHQIEEYFKTQLSALPADILAMVGLMKIDICFTMILSAVAAKQALAGWNKLTDRRSTRVWHPPGGAPGQGGTREF